MKHESIKDSEDLFAFEGDLYSRKLGYSTPLRRKYDYLYRNIDCSKKLASCLRYGDYVWPGGYSIAYVCSDGGILCPDCVRGNYASIIDSIRHDIHDGWKVVGIIVSNEIDEIDENCINCEKNAFE